MKKNLVWILIIILVIGGIFYAIANKGEKQDLNADNDILEEDKNNEYNGEVEEPDHTHEYEIEVGKVLPDFTLKNLDGKDISLSDYKDKIVLINFWATWCGFCDAEMPDLQRLHEENDDLVVLAVNVLEEKDVVEKYVEKGGYDFEVVLDAEGRVSHDYFVSGLPASYFTNKDGIFLGRVPGMLTYDQMNEILEGIREDEEYK